MAVEASRDTEEPKSWATQRHWGEAEQREGEAGARNHYCSKVLKSVAECYHDLRDRGHLLTHRIITTRETVIVTKIKAESPEVAQGHRTVYSKAGIRTCELRIGLVLRKKQRDVSDLESEKNQIRKSEHWRGSLELTAACPGLPQTGPGKQESPSPQALWGKAIRISNEYVPRSKLESATKSQAVSELREHAVPSVPHGSSARRLYSQQERRDWGRPPSQMNENCMQQPALVASFLPETDNIDPIQEALNNYIPNGEELKGGWTEPQSSLLLPDQDGPSEKLGQRLATEALGTNSWGREKACRELGPARAHSASQDRDPTPPPSSRGKKKKKKSTRKKRRRSPSYSPSPVKKKKKKSSKKHKRHRSFSKKRRHSSCSPKSKRREEKRHKKQSRSRKSHRHRHHRGPSRSQSSELRSPSCESRHRGRSPEEGRKSRRTHSRRCSKNHCKVSPEARSSHLPSQPLQRLGFLSARGVISGSGSAADLFSKSASPLAASRGRSQEYDSGNDTSSPPSTQTSSARSQGQEKGSPGGDLSKSRDLNCGNTSDSGNSFTTSSPQNKGAVLENVSPACRSSESRGFQSPCLQCAEVKKSSLVPSTARSSPIKECSRSSSYTSTRSSSLSSRSPNPRASPRSTRSRSTSSEKRSYSRSPSYSSKSGKRSPPSRSSRSRRSPSYSRYSPSRERDPKYGEKEPQPRERARRRRRSYSPMRKRRRDSPSHLEARRITSARKRPIPYYRPSPSSSSSLSSASSWYSSSSSRSASRSYSRSRSPSRSRSSRSQTRSRTRTSRSSSSRSLSLGSRSRSRNRSLSYSSAESYASTRR
ncbi:serine/arginine repetitive matrix protein 4 [Rattus rattus]|uniref:serine/arginine repetitive matrix protein 4 n=1 Tax=Rattus rattus TaxID=10117 RepID=UPI0013F31F5E|nr:serine/arginine repetitive matrix protein 4 [Rattus rattus]